MRTFYVRKESNTFSDAIECFGLVSILEGIFNQFEILRKPEILIEDKGFYYQISCEKDITDEMINKCQYFDFLRFIKNKKDRDRSFTFDSIDYEHEKEIRDNYYALPDQERQTTENPVHPDYDIIRLFANMEGYRKSFINQRAFIDNFEGLLECIVKLYSKIECSQSEIEQELKEYIRNKKLTIEKINALQDINPDKGKGVNQGKASGIRPEGVSDFWLRQLIRFSGAWSSFISRYFDKDYKTYSIVPHSISNEYIRSVYRGIKPYIRGKESIKIDILMIHLITIELIKRHHDYERYEDFFSPADKISGFQMAYYQNLGQRPAVTNIGFLGLPDFIRVESIESGNVWIGLFNEHQKIISGIDENNSSNIRMLQAYRQFLSASDFMAFFDFCFDYADFLIRSIDAKKYFINPLTITNMEVLMCTKSNFSAILSNPGFRAVAEAIRNSTIVPIIHDNKKDIVFGLSNRLKIASRNPESLMEEISLFAQHYNEEIMLKDYHQQLHKSYLKTEDLESFCALLDEGHSSKLIAGMLIAYGYAKEPAIEKK